MINQIKLSGLTVNEWDRGKYTFIVFEILCHECLSWSTLRRFHPRFINKKYFCNSCSKSGKRNSFYGKKHTKESKKKQSENAHRVFGVDNHFYGRKHSKESMETMAQKRRNNALPKRFAGKNWVFA